MAESVRMRKVAEDIKQKLNSVMSRELSEMNLGLVTITRVIMSPDLKIAKVYFSVLGAKETPQVAQERINSRSRTIRYNLAKHITMKFVPDLLFFYDDSSDYADKINKIFKDLKDEEERKKAGETSTSGEANSEGE